jgi:hypothetical protein
MSWYVFNNGTTIGTLGTEKGVIIRYEMKDFDTRVVLNGYAQHHDSK